MLTDIQLFLVVVILLFIGLYFINKTIENFAEEIVSPSDNLTPLLTSPSDISSIIKQTSSTITSIASDLLNKQSTNTQVTSPETTLTNPEKKLTSPETTLTSPNTSPSSDINNLLNKTSINGYVYYGCYSDKKAPNRFLPNRLESDQKIEIEKCASLAAASGEKIFGFQNESKNKGECWVGNNKNINDINNTLNKINTDKYDINTSCKLSTTKNLPVGRSWSNAIYINSNN